MIEIPKDSRTVIFNSCVSWVFHQQPFAAISGLEPVFKKRTYLLTGCTNQLSHVDPPKSESDPPRLES